MAGLERTTVLRSNWRGGLFYFGKWFRPSVGFVGEFFAILLKFFWKKNILLHTNSLYFFFKKEEIFCKNRQNSPQYPKIKKRYLNFFYFHSFEYCQIWLKILGYNHHLSNMTKLKKKRKKKKEKPLILTQANERPLVTTNSLDAPEVIYIYTPYIPHQLWCPWGQDIDCTSIAHLRLLMWRKVPANGYAYCLVFHVVIN